MISKILGCKTSFEVLEIIDRKIGLITKRTNDMSLISQFINSSLARLKDLNVTAKSAEQHSKIRSAIAHLQNLQIRFNIR